MTPASPTPSPALDGWERPLRSVRLSVTDRCNLRCRYCMPEESYTWLPRKDLLTFEELTRLARVLASLGASRYRITGGEPLLRQELPVLVGMLHRLQPTDLALTTNGVRFAEHARALVDAGLTRVTFSLDTLQPERFAQLTGRPRLPEVLRSIETAAEVGLRNTKVNVVVMRGINHEEVARMLAWGRERALEIRFIEYMDVGGATEWSFSQVVGKAEILRLVERELGPVTPEATDPHAPAQRYRLADGTRFGVIASTTEPFCRSCDRVRITADGLLLTCLYGQRGVDLRVMLRGGASDAQLRERLRQIWQGRRDRGAEERLAVRQRGPLVQLPKLRQNPHLEMHTRGG